MTLRSLLEHQSFWLTAIAGSMGGIWALSEIIGQFRTETARALRTWGAWMLVLFNIVAAAVIYLLIIGLAPGARTWPTALAVGLAWPTIFRNASLKLSQPITDAQGANSPAIRLEEVYGNIQKLALQLINGVLTRQRTRLLTEALRFELGDLERYARRMIALSPQQVDATLIDKVLERNIDDEAKKAYLAALVMDTFTRSALDDFIREKRKG